jgi:glycine/D-amino acid oxidase-like deaminating enzyme
MFDDVVVGGGIAGLYAALKLVRKGHKVALIERDRTLGGRARTAEFGGATVATGAGIGRKAKDATLQALLKALRVPNVHEFQVIHTTPAHCQARDMFFAVRAAYERRAAAGARPRDTFRSFATRVLGIMPYKHLVLCSGYSDFEQADVADVLYNYGFEDNFSTYVGLSVPWAALVGAMQAELTRAGCTLWTGCTATALVPDGEHYTVHTTRGPLVATTVILATEIAGVRALLPHEPMYFRVHAQPFVRLYALFSRASAKIVKAAIKGVTVVEGPLQKIIGMSDRVFMVAYSDNASALAVHRAAPDGSAASRLRVARMVEDALGLRPGVLHIEALQLFFLPSGTHYNDPGLHAVAGQYKLQHPAPNVFVVGEAVARHQGWVEGALESVDAVL